MLARHIRTAQVCPHLSTVLALKGIPEDPEELIKGQIFWDCAQTLNLVIHRRWEPIVDPRTHQDGRCNRREVIGKYCCDSTQHGWKMILMVEIVQFTKHNRVADQFVNWSPDPFT